MIDKLKAYQEISNWLASNRNLDTGIKLHYKYSTNEADKLKIFKMSYPIKVKFIENKLTEICGFCKPTVDNPIKNSVESKPEVKKEIPIEIPIKRISVSVEEKLRTEFPKIVFRELPDTLKLLVFERYDAKRDAIAAHKQMHDAENDEQRFEAVSKCVLKMKLNWQIWEELNHWHMYNKVLGVHPKFTEKTFIDEIKEIENSKPASEATKIFMNIRTKAKNNIHEYLRKKELTDIQKNKMQQWIWKYNIVSQKLGEPEWQK